MRGLKSDAAPRLGAGAPRKEVSRVDVGNPVAVERRLPQGWGNGLTVALDRNP
jgi:hypothetical protein